MKKALVVLLVLAVVGVASFADVKWSVSSLYGFGVVSNSVGNSTIAFDNNQEGTGRTRLTAKINSDDGNVGFLVRMQDGGVANIAPTWNQLYGWGKLFGGMLTVKGGILDDYTVSIADWGAFGGYDGKPGVMFDVTPMAGLDIAFIQVIPNTQSWTGTTGDVIGLKYALPNLVTVAAGVTLDLTTAGVANGNVVYFGFDVSAVPGLTAKVELQAALYNGDTPITVYENLGYAMGPLTVRAYAYQYNDKTGLDWGVEPQVSYKVNDNITVTGIANIYNYGNSGQAAKASNETFLSPINAGALAGGPVKTMLFGGGAQVGYTMGGITLVLGDFYGADSTQGNLFYVNVDVSL